MSFTPSLLANFKVINLVGLDVTLYDECGTQLFCFAAVEKAAYVTTPHISPSMYGLPVVAAGTVVGLPLFAPDRVLIVNDAVGKFIHAHPSEYLGAVLMPDTSAASVVPESIYPGIAVKRFLVVKHVGGQ